MCHKYVPYFHKRQVEIQNFGVFCHFYTLQVTGSAFVFKKYNQIYNYWLLFIAYYILVKQPCFNAITVSESLKKITDYL